MVGDDTVWNTKPIEDVKEELNRLFREDIGDGLHLYPLGECVHRYEQVSEAARGLFEGSNHVDAPDYEWPGDGDGLKLLCWQMSLLSIELASFTPTDNLLCISQRSGPVKTMVKGFLD